MAVLDALGLSAPFRISSIPQGAKMRPGIYTIIEDVISVDTGTSRHYREAINARYEASPRFRRMLRQLNWFWAIPALLVGAAVTALVWVQRIEQTTSYGIGMTHMKYCLCGLVTDLSARLGSSSRLGYHLGGNHHFVCATMSQKREGGMGQRP